MSMISATFVLLVTVVIWIGGLLALWYSHHYTVYRDNRIDTPDLALKGMWPLGPGIEVIQLSCTWEYVRTTDGLIKSDKPHSWKAKCRGSVRAIHALRESNLPDDY